MLFVPEDLVVQVLNHVNWMLVVRLFLGHVKTDIDKPRLIF